MFRNQLQAIKRWIADAAGPVLLQATLPSTCAGCGRAGSWICDHCQRLLRSVNSRGCRRCGRNGRVQHQCERCTPIFPPALSTVRAGFVYDGPMRRAIHRFKYSGEYQRGHDLGARLGARVGQLLPTSHIDLVVPVPLHPRRYRSRGYNQAEILAKAVASTIDIPVVNAVHRIRHTTSQVELSADRRLVNLLGAFDCDREASPDLNGKTILVIDDVTTTGATLAAVADALQSVGGVTVYGLALARDQ